MNTLPLGILKQACMKLDSFMQDIHEIMEDSQVSSDDKQILMQLTEAVGTIEMNMINIVSNEMDVNEFLQESVEMDDIDEYPDDGMIDPLDDILDVDV